MVFFGENLIIEDMLVFDIYFSLIELILSKYVLDMVKRGFSI